jgi:hypothetical protein
MKIFLDGFVMIIDLVSGFQKETWNARSIVSVNAAHLFSEAVILYFSLLSTKGEMYGKP